MSRKPIGIGLLATLSLLACQGERGAVVEAVRAYDAAIIETYHRNDATAMRGLAAQEELNRLTALVDLKRGSRLTLMSELQRFEVRSVEVRDGQATVATGERWRYFDRPDDPRRAVGDVFVADMVLEYTLVKEGGVWKVQKARTLSSDYLEPKGFQPGRRDHGDARPEVPSAPDARQGEPAGGRTRGSP